MDRHRIGTIDIKLTSDWPWIDIRSVRDRHQIGNGLALDWHQIGTGLENCLWIDIGLAKVQLNRLTLDWRWIDIRIGNRLAQDWEAIDIGLARD